MTQNRKHTPTQKLSEIPTNRSHPLDINTGALEYNRLLFQTTKAAQFYIGLGQRTVLLKRLSDADDMLKEGFDPLQPRDGNGRWTAGGATDDPSFVTGDGNSNTLLSPAGIAIGASVADFGQCAFPPLRLPSIFGAIGRVTTAALEAFGAALDAPVVAFGAWFVPLRDGAAGTANLPGDPDVKYHYDEDAGTFSVSTSDHETLFEGSIGGDGTIRTEDGQVIGRHVDGSLIIDTSKLPIDEDKQQSIAGAGVSAQTQAETDTQDRLCPIPLPDVPGFRSPRSLAYQGFINTIVDPAAPLPPTLAIYLPDPKTGRPVAYDNCYEQTGVPVDAKGPGYDRLLSNRFTQYFVDLKFVKQAERQVRAADGRPVIWYVDEPETAAHLTSLFARPELSEKGLGRISVVNMPMPDALRKYLISDGEDLFELEEN